MCAILQDWDLEAWLNALMSLHNKDLYDKNDEIFGLFALAAMNAYRIHGDKMKMEFSKTFRKAKIDVADREYQNEINRMFKIFKYYNEDFFTVKPEIRLFGGPE